MEPINTNRDRLAAPHHYDREPGSRVTIARRRSRPVSPAVQPQTLSPQQQASVALLGARPGTVSLLVIGGAASLTGPSVERGAAWSGSARTEPQARLPRPRLLQRRDRRRIVGVAHPTAHPAIGRPVLSPNIIPFRGP